MRKAEVSEPPQDPRRHLVPVQSFADRLVGPRFGIRSQQMAAGERRLHRHDYFEILFFVTGGPQQRIRLRDYVSRRGSIFLVSPMTPHQPRFGPTDCCFVIYFDLSYLRPDLSSVDSSHIDSELLARVPELAPFVCQHELDYELSENQVEVLQKLCERMLQEQNEPRLCSQEVTRACLAMLLSEVTQTYEQDIKALVRDHPPMGGTDRHVRRVLEFIEKNLAQKITLTLAAQAASVSPNYLANLLRRETGQTFVDLVTARRMDRACELLSFTRLRVSQIGDAVGFFDVDYFCRRFKQTVGCTPLEYRATQSLVQVAG